MRVQNAAAAVCALAREHELRTFTVELRAPVDQFVNGPAGASSTSFRTAAGIAQSITCDERIVLMQLDIVLITQRGGDTALRVCR